VLFTQAVLSGIRDGRVTLAFRRWARPTVKAGGTLLTPVGQLRILAVDRIDREDIGKADAASAGYAEPAALLRELDARPGTLYRIRFEIAGEDPRIALRQRASLDAHEIDTLRQRLARLDQSPQHGPWTGKVLRLLRDHPAEAAASLARRLGVDKQWLKLNIRKLKNLGLTESLEVGYRLSPRGEAWLRNP
jgi:hypothetical protein